MRNNKTVMIVGGVILAVVVLAGVFILGTKQAQKKASTQSLPEEVVIPTVDSSVVVELKQIRKSVGTLSVKNAPSGTNKIEYQISYNAKPGAAFSEDAAGMDVVPQGFQGTCKPNGAIWECGNEEPIVPGKRVIVFGSSSSGVYRFHDIVGPVKVSLKFSGSYGAKIFEKDYEL